MGNITKAATTFLMFAALSEIILDCYEYTSLLRQYDSNLITKLRNLKANFERTSKHAHGLFTDEEQLSFFNMIRIFEQLIKAAGDTRDFSELTAMIDSWLKNDLTMIHTKQDLLDTAKMVENRDADEDPDFEDDEPDYSNFDCTCGAWVWSEKKSKFTHIADCICGSSEPF